MQKKERAQWGSKIGFILAAAGSAIGLGNIWKFPGKAYEGGGGTYLLIYIAIVVLIGMPAMLAELSLGRATRANTVDAFKKLNKRFTWVGYLGVISAFIITCYYSHVGGWVLRYVFSYVTEPKAVYADSLGYFYNMLGYNASTGATFMPWTALAFAAVFLALNAVIIIRGVQGGIEKFSKYCMPALFVLLFVLLIRSVTIDGAKEGVKYLLTFNFEALTFDTLLSALGQAFYSLSLGMAIMITYGSYVAKEENLAKNTVLICSMDTLVAIIAGFIVIPAVFATMGSGSVGKGGGFAFASLAGVFENMPMGSLFGVVFYLLLLFAALTSCISLTEGIVAFITERVKISRKACTIILCVVMYLIGCLYACSQAAFDWKGIWFDFTNKLTYPALGDFMEYLTDRLLIPVGALFTSIFVGWVWKPGSSLAEVESGCTVKKALRTAYGILIKYVVPLSILVILLVSLIKGATLS